MELRSGSGVVQGSAGLEKVREGVVVRREAVVEQAAVDLEGFGMLLSEEEGLDHGVADAESWAAGVPEEEMCVG